MNDHEMNDKINYRENLINAKRIVIKIGTSSITYENGSLNLKKIERLAFVISDLRNQGKEVILVSSGAIGVGSVRLGFSKRPKEMSVKQAAAAVGQAVLMQIYHNCFMQYNQNVAQILITREETQNDKRLLNTINTFDTLLNLGVIPIVNENDTISTYEIEFSDNDTLSATVATFMNADLLIILTDIDSLYDGDPRTNKGAKRIVVVEEITSEIISMGGKNGSAFSVGGMATKITAAKLCVENGCDVVIASGDDPSFIHSIIDGDDIGTLFIKST